jgi:hypothetical protein
LQQYQAESQQCGGLSVRADGFSLVGAVKRAVIDREWRFGWFCRPDSWRTRVSRMPTIERARPE